MIFGAVPFPFQNLLLISLPKLAPFHYLSQQNKHNHRITTDSMMIWNWLRSQSRQCLRCLILALAQVIMGLGFLFLIFLSPTDASDLKHYGIISMSVAWIIFGLLLAGSCELLSPAGLTLWLGLNAFSIVAESAYFFKVMIFAHGPPGQCTAGFDEDCIAAMIRAAFVAMFPGKLLVLPAAPA